MNKAKKTHEIRFRASDADLQRLEILEERLELPRAEVLRYFIRDGYAALAARVETVGNAQLRLFQPTLTDGLTAIPVPLPTQLPEKPK